MQLKILPTGAFAANCSIVWNEPDKAMVFDPGADAALLIDELRKNDLTPCAYILTHGHIDHISALPEMLEEMPAPVYMHKNDAIWAFTPINSIDGYESVKNMPKNIVTDITDGSVIEAGTLTARIICTPGHTPGGMCCFFESENLLIAGDTLFNGSVGRTDLPGGDWNTLETSLSKLMELDDSTAVICGHGPNTTIGNERNANPFINKTYI
jgi:hydroxyacylglutathione hydrolase